MKTSYSPTLGQIAKELGVSISTVSRVVAGRKSRISENTKAKVLETAARLGYTRNFMASVLSRGAGTRTIGICVSLDEFFSRVIDGMVAALGRLGYAAIVMPARPGGPHEQDVFRAFVERRVEGVMLRPGGASVKPDSFKELDERGIPVVIVDAGLPDLNAPFSGTDDYAGGRMAAQTLLSLGHKVLGHVAGDPDISTAILRKKGFLDAVAETGAKAVICRHEGYVSDARAIRQTLLENPDITALFCANDNIALCAYHAAGSLGLRIPDDLSVIGFANQNFAETMTPPLCSFDQRPATIGENAVKLLFDLANGKDGSKDASRLVRPELVMRASIAKPSKKTYPR